jgi:DHA1 family bicyclomycin/chloramphenicol resistance-like MFS transporter
MNLHQQLVNSKKKLVFLILVLGSITAIGPITIDMYLPAFAAISESFAAPKNMVQLSLAAYFIGLSLGQLLYGPVIDRFGKKIPLFFGLTVFTISSIACCFTQDIEHFIILRFFQALGACSGIVVPRAIVRDIFSPQESAQIFSHLMLVMGLGPILAPILGSFILNVFGWKMIFIFLGAFGILCLLLTKMALPKTKGPDPDEKISNGLKKYLGILHDRNFVVCSFSGGLAMAGMFSYVTGSPFVYLQFFGLSAKYYSLVFAVNAFGYITAAQINAKILKKIPIEKVLAKVLFIPAFTGGALIFVSINNPAFWPFTITLFTFIASIGAISPGTTALALANQSKYSGSASALLGTTQFGLATIASVLVSSFHSGNIIFMALIVGMCGILSCLVYKIFQKNYVSRNS